MCGRYTLISPWRELVRLYRLNDKYLQRNTEARYNIAPTQEVPFIHLDNDGNQVVSDGRWWLVPHWAKELQSKYPMFNARSEDAEKKPAFRDAYKTRRCLIPADGWYEWTKGEDGGRDPWFIHLPDMAPFSFAGLWTHNNALGVTSCTILTAPAVAPISQVHNRMPIVLDQAAYEDWISSETSVKDAKALLGQNMRAQFELHRVDRQVNSVNASSNKEFVREI
ncbi:SOS response-associated peptidase [Labrenzia sp. PO1]|uniref:SOS response-associated peptidase n=1 Tax=Labrenzia sp. PO1 TaxID=2720390 RepID=UPI001445E0C3|nr:SOS response-associated peptidase [Labrenzia sp. PO1]NKI61758.1 SOS response-associated peptidase [Labrenzia sp. PO1]